MNSHDKTSTSRLQRFHKDEEGAVLMLVLAGVLICFMTALVLYDTGLAATDKMSSQVAADTSAFSASVVKARSMNMVSVANTNKRVLYGTAVTYNAAALALVESEAVYAASCASSWGTNVSACYNAVVGGIQVAVEAIEFAATNLWHLTKTTKAEVKALEKYQDYLITVTPWWAWIDGVMRASRNNGTFAATWPPPGDVAEVLDNVTQIIQGIDFIFGGSLSSYIPAHSSSIDGLPLGRRDKEGSFITAYPVYCYSYVFSLDHVMTFAEHYLKSSSSGISRKGQTLGLYAVTVVTTLPCLAAHGMLSNDVFDYRIKGAPQFYNPFNGSGSSTDPGDEWLQSTSMLSVGYKAKAGRNSDEGGRQKYGYMNQDYGDLTKKLTGNEGQMAIARSEIVYKQQSLLQMAFGVSLPSLSGSNSSQAEDAGGRPEMWNPAWTARLRPVTLPGETFGNSVVFQGDGDPVGLSEMGMDMVPFLVLSGLIGLLQDDTSLESMIHDMVFFAAASKGFDSANMEGIVK
jgi:hypothetical protein